ncbi:MAG: GNAT family N-acetyltransferase [Chroococcales cyanobacterium]
MRQYYQEFLIRDWESCDRHAAANVIRDVLIEYGLPWQPDEADQDVIEVEKFYLNSGGEFWVIEQQGNIIGTGAYYPVKRGNNAVEIRKMYLLPSVRGKGLGKYLLKELEKAIEANGFQEIWIETASLLKEAVQLYESSGYQPETGIETKRCDRIYCKKLCFNT